MVNSNRIGSFLSNALFFSFLSYEKGVPYRKTINRLAKKEFCFRLRDVQY